MVEKGDIFSAGLLQSEIAGRRNAAVRPLEKTANAIVDPAELLDRFRRVVTRSVIDNYQLEILERLPKQTFDGRGEIRSGIKHRHDNGDGRSAAHRMKTRTLRRAAGAASMDFAEEH